MVRAFIDVFPQSVLLSGAQAELLARSARRAADRARSGSCWQQHSRGTPEVREDLARVDLGTVREIAGTFVGVGATRSHARRSSLPR